MIGHHLEVAADKLVLLFEEGLQHAKCLHLVHKVQVLHVGEFLRYESSPPVASFFSLFIPFYHMYF